MCGIVGGVSTKRILPVLLEGLKRLEYRGYDSAGVALLGPKNNILRERVLGKVSALVDSTINSPMLLTSNLGIAHTRWATHGKPSIENAHPHLSGDSLAVVHNGIIENHAELKDELTNQGCLFSSQTDTEIIAHLLAQAQTQTDTFIAALLMVLNRLRGAFSLGVMVTDTPNQLYAVRHGSPLVIGIGQEGYYFASDMMALLGVCDRFLTLEEGDIAILSVDGLKILNLKGNDVEREVSELKIAHEVADRGSYRHFMQKEIFEQPLALSRTIFKHILSEELNENSFDPALIALLDKASGVHIVACGTSYHAGMVAKYWIEKEVGIPCQVEVASEYRYRKPVVPSNTLFVTISQSGETADTYQALKSAQTKPYIGILTICNVKESMMVQESDAVILTEAGREIGVASTKAFTAQLAALLMLTVLLAKKQAISSVVVKDLTESLVALPSFVEKVLRLDSAVQAVANHFNTKRHALFLGRGVHYPIAIEGALKLKEISYIHAEAYPAGELKHGPLALVDERMPVVALAPNNDLIEKLKSNLQEVHARGGELIIFTEADTGVSEDENKFCVHLPKLPEIIAPIVYTVPLQMLAYHVAVLRGTDVDQPRNLAKSVTVE